MSCCDECGSTSYLEKVGDRYICEKCIIWYDSDEEDCEYIDEDDDDEDYWLGLSKTQGKSTMERLGQGRRKENYTSFDLRARGKSAYNRARENCEFKRGAIHWLK